MASEWWTSPSEAGRRLEEVTALWAGVQNAALGRGTTPLVPAELADQVVAEVNAFRAWRAQVEGWQWGVQWADELRDWTGRANASRARVAAALKAAGKTAALPAPVTEWSEVAPQAVATAFAGMSGLALGLGALALMLMVRRK